MASSIQPEYPPSEPETPGFGFRPMRWPDARAIAAWRYAEPYALYNFGPLMPPAIVLLRPLLSHIFGADFYAVDGADGDLVGVFSFFRRTRTVTIGLAMRPDLTGQGLGLAFVRAGMAKGRASYAPETFHLTVATFNHRAITVYERAGFRPGRRFLQHTRRGPTEFMEMTRAAGGAPFHRFS
jgi:ribosomal-protein-alanine N-acetyltransferase